MRLNSRSLVLQCLSRSSAMSRSQIINATGLSRAHVCNVVDELLASGELLETGHIKAGRGRPARLLKINDDSCYVGGVWLAEDWIEVGVAGATGEALARRTLFYSGDPVDDIDAVAEGIRDCAEQAGRCSGKLRGVGVVVAGLVNPALGVICAATHREHGFVGVPITRMLQERLQIPVYADTDIRAAAMSGQWNNSRCERVLYIQCGEGVGAALVVGGEVFGGTHGAAPVLGRMPIGPSETLEPRVSNYAFVESLWPNVEARKLTAAELREMVRQGIDLATSGDLSALAAISRIAEYLGLGVTTAVSLLDPQKVFIAGTLVDSFPDLMIDIIRRETVARVDPLLTGVDIQPLVGWRDFELKGAFDLVLLSGFRSMNQEISEQLMNPWQSEYRMINDRQEGPVAVRRQLTK